MEGFINIILMLGGLAAGVAVTAMCGLCLLVWLAGLLPTGATGAWRHLDDA